MFPQVSADEIATRIAYGPVAGCWEWQGSRDKKGYGRLCRRVAGRPVVRLAHRVSYETHRGAIPDGLSVCHHCDNPPCVNPDHLFVGTNADNMNDAIAKGRRTGPTSRRSRAVPGGNRGHLHHSARLTDEDAIAIVEGCESLRSLADRFSVQVSTIRAVRLGRSWRHATGVPRVPVAKAAGAQVPA